MAYAYLTFAAARIALAARLQDPANQYWAGAELDQYVSEALRVWNALTGSYKQTGVFSTLADGSFYDLTLSLSSLLGYSVNDTDIASQVMYALLEPQLTPGWTGTGQFSLAQIQTAVQNRINRYLGDSGCVVSTLPVLTGPTPPNDLAALPDSVLDVRRVAWVPITTPPTVPLAAYPIGRMDEWSEQAYVPSNNASFPAGYSVFGVPPSVLRVIPPPLDSGALDLLVVESGPTVNLNPSVPVLMQIPDDLSWAVKWGALADILASDGPSRDSARATYCETRYEEAVAIARVMPTLLLASANNQTIGTGSVFDLDAYLPAWQIGRGAPSFLGMCGRNIACLGITPDNVYSISAWVTANMPTVNSPGQTGASFVQIGRDAIDPVLDYAQHIASFKMGGSEFTATERLKQNFLTAAARQNNRLSAISVFREQLQRPEQKSQLTVSRM